MITTKTVSDKNKEDNEDKYNRSLMVTMVIYDDDDYDDDDDDEDDDDDDDDDDKLIHISLAILIVAT